MAFHLDYGALKEHCEAMNPDYGVLKEHCEAMNPAYGAPRNTLGTPAKSKSAV